MPDILKEQIDKLQAEYLTILKMASEKINEETYQAVVDEILVFWKKHKRVALSIATHYITPMKTLVFTGATFMNIDDLEHYPFLAIGEKHILDDPLCRYLEVVDKFPDKDTAKGFYEQALLTIKDNIKVIEQCHPHIIILPLRYLYGDDEEVISKAAIDAFLSMFNDDVKTLSDYRPLKTMEEIQDSLLPGMAKTIVFDSGEDKSVGLIERFNAYLSNARHMQYFKTDINQLFFMTVIGYLAQALNIILMCYSCQCIPYVRYEVAFKYLIRISCNFEDVPEIQEMVFKSSVAHVFYNSFDKEQYEEIDFNSFMSLCEQNNSKSKVYDALEKQGMNIKTSNLKSIIEIVESYLNELKPQ